MKLPDYIIKIVKTLYKNGYQAWVVGGSLRDLMLGKEPNDYDIATNSRPEEVMKIFQKVIPTGIKHGTVTILMDNNSIEVTTFRKDGKYVDGRRPDTITYASTIYEDISRRDFTINGIAYNPITDQIIDPFNGIDDIKNKIIRTIGNPIERFREDGLRCFRACRFSSQLNFSIEKNTFEAIKKSIDIASKISAERIRDEFIKIIISPKPSIGLECMRESGLLESFMPELLDGYGVEQNRYHKYDVYYHNIYTCDAASGNDYRIRLAALLHDIGKPYAKKEIEGSNKEGKKSVFYNHEIIGASISKKIMKRLKFSNADINFVTHLIRNHMFHYTENWTEGAVRRFLRKVGIENLDALFELRRADRIGNGLKKGESNAIKRFKERIEKIIEQENAITVKDLAINGNDIMETFNLKPGPIIGKILNNLLEVILDEPEKNKKEILLNIAKDIIEKEKPILNTR